MSVEPLLTISTFARAVDLPPSALRYYHEAGLLPPAEVDPETGYRYYTPELERRAHLVRRMREIGVSVDTMRMVLDGPADRASDILRGFAERMSREARWTNNVVDELLLSLQDDEQDPAEVAVTIDGPELAAALRRVAGASSTETGTALCGILLDADSTSVTAVATNRYWLAAWSVPCAEAVVSTRRAFLASAQVGGAVDWLARRGTVTMSFGIGRIGFQAGDQSRVFATGEDRFPAYRMIEEGPPEPTGRVSVSIGSLRSVIGQGTEGSSIRFAVGNDRVVVSRAGESEGTKLAAVTHGQPLVLWFSGTLLDQALATMVGSEVTFVYAAVNRPVRIAPAEQRRLSVLLMPSAAQT